MSGLDQTIKLYDEDSYLKEFEGTVVAAETIPDSDNEWWIILDRTAFFPEAGGQTPDRGTIAGAEVLDVQITDGVIRHRVGCEIAVGTAVGCKLDWAHRFSNMQNHTGEHIFSGIVHKLFGYDNVGFHLSEHIVTMDYNGPLSPDDVARVELLSNRAIWESHAISTSFPSDEELEKLDYRSKGELTPPIRIVKIEDVDLCACCAPHVKNTAEVGILKVIDTQKYKGGIRLSILCGERALYDYRNRQDTMVSLSQILSVKQEELTSETTRILDECGRLEAEIRRQQERELRTRLSEVPDDQEDVWIYSGDIDPNVARSAMDDMASKHTGYCGIFYGSGENRRFFIIAGKIGQKDAREALALLKEHFEVKGGGSAGMVQGSVSADEPALRKVFG